MKIKFLLYIKTPTLRIIFYIHGMLGHLFYAFGLFIVFAGIWRIQNWKLIWESLIWTKTFREVNKKIPIKTDFKNPLYWNTIVTFGVILIFEFIFISFGLFSKSWYIYLLIILVNVLNNYISDLLVKIKLDIVSKYFLLSWNLVKTLIILFLIINHFHLHLNIYDVCLTHLK